LPLRDGAVWNGAEGTAADGPPRDPDVDIAIFFAKTMGYSLRFWFQLFL
jgi:hypothetical protein